MIHNPAYPGVKTQLNRRITQIRSPTHKQDSVFERRVIQSPWRGELNGSLRSGGFSMVGVSLGKTRGVPRVDDRRVLNGIFWRLRTGAPWADIPARHGPRTTCVNRFDRWRDAVVRDRVLAAVSKIYAGDVQMVDSSSMRGHQPAANGQKSNAIPLHGPLMRRADHQNPCRGGCLRPADPPQDHQRPGA